MVKKWFLHALCGEEVRLKERPCQRGERGGITEYSFIGYPDKGMFALAKEDLVNKVLEAPYGTFPDYTFGEVFQ